MVCLIFVFLIIGITEFFPYQYNFPENLSGEIVRIGGKVSAKEIQTKDGQTTYLIYLKQIKSQSVSDTDQSGDADSKLTKLNTA